VVEVSSPSPEDRTQTHFPKRYVLVVEIPDAGQSPKTQQFCVLDQKMVVIFKSTIFLKCRLVHYDYRVLFSVASVDCACTCAKRFFTTIDIDGVGQNSGGGIF
jgi:hypothetical protein